MQAIKTLLYNIADDLLIIGHRHSEWTGLGPILEEDISFSSLAQDKIGLAYQIYKILHENEQEDTADRIAFLRDDTNYRCCQFVELPNGEYDFSLIRHFLFDHAMDIRFKMFEKSNYQPLTFLSRKTAGEMKYHILHADIWIKRLGTGNEISHQRMQKALEYAFPYSLGMFEAFPYEKELIELGIYPGENELKIRWIEKISWILKEANLILPEPSGIHPILGGRNGSHSEYLKPLLKEMNEVYSSDPGTEW